MIIVNNKPFISPLQQTRRLFALYTYYRLVLVVVLWIIDAGIYTRDLTGTLIPELFTYTLLLYGLYQGLLLFLLRNAHFPHKAALFVNGLIDISAMSLILLASAGVSSGMGGLLIPVIAASNILLTGRAGIFFAAYASVGILAIENYIGAYFPDVGKNFFQAGVLGGAYFLAALFIQHIAKRAHQSETIVQQQALDLADLEELNHLIIQRLRMGIIVVDENLRIRTINEMARNAIGGQAHTIPDILIERLMHWRTHPNERPALFRLSDNLPELQPNFTPVTFISDEHVIIFLEDTSQLAQQAQQLKLASLGRLTASIAHEIRNPLGAISHAAQLLAESEHLDQADHHLLDMIKKHAMRMNGVIENILTLSRQTTPQPDTIDLKTWVTQFVQDYHSNYDDTAISIDIALPQLPVNIDTSQLNQILVNLCDNGLRYSKKHTNRATLLLKGGILKENDCPYLDIIDDGPGISEEIHPHLFEPFYTTEATGNGLGLYICKGLCELNQASLDYINYPKNGACFRLIFPHPQRILN